MNASGALLFNTVLHEKFAQELTENDYLQYLLLELLERCSKARVRVRQKFVSLSLYL